MAAVNPEDMVDTLVAEGTDSATPRQAGPSGVYRALGGTAGPGEFAFQLSQDTSMSTNASLARPPPTTVSEFVSQQSSVQFDTWASPPSATSRAMPSGATSQCSTPPVAPVAVGPGYPGHGLRTTPPLAPPPPVLPIAKLPMPRELLSGPPKSRAPDPPDSTSLVRLFVGNVRFEMTAEGLQYIFRNVCGVDVPLTHLFIQSKALPSSNSVGSLGSQSGAASASVLAASPSGCAVAFVDPASADRLLEFNQRIFCTANGDVCFGTFPAMRSAIPELLNADIDARSRRRKGPKNCMVIERSNASTPSHLFAPQAHAPVSAPVPLVASLAGGGHNNRSLSPGTGTPMSHLLSMTPNGNGSFGHGRDSAAGAAPSYGTSISSSIPTHLLHAQGFLGGGPHPPPPPPVHARTHSQLPPAAPPAVASSAASAADAAPPAPLNMPFYRFPLAPPSPLPSNQQPLLSASPQDPLISGHSSASTTGTSTPAHGLAAATPSASSMAPSLPPLMNPFELFVGGLPYEADEAFVAWMLNACCPGVFLSPERIQLFQSKGGGHSGCAIAHIEAGQATALLPLNKRIFCTANGFYLASTRDAMDAYVRQIERQKGEKRTGPSHAVVLEAKKSERKAAMGATAGPPPPPPPPTRGGGPPQKIIGGIFSNLWPPQLPFFVQPFMPWSTPSVVPGGPRVTPPVPSSAPPPAPTSATGPSISPASNVSSSSSLSGSAPKPSYRKQ